MNTPSFLPEDYLAEKAQKRTNLICLTLFGVVMCGVFGAFLVSNRDLSAERSRHRDINAKYQNAAVQIEQLTELEAQMEEMLHTAELASALVERVPRSILLAELINRMPPHLSLLSFELESKQVKAVPRPNANKSDKDGLATPQRGKTKQEAAEEAKEVEIPKHRVEIVMTGVAPTDLEVSSFLSSLSQFPLLDRATLEYSEEKEIEGQPMREFSIRMALPPGADIREYDPFLKPRDIRDPMTNDVQIAPQAVNVTPNPFQD